MKGWLDPVGQEPTRTYWIRRGVVAAVIIAVLVTISLLVTRPGSNRQQAATTAVAATPSASATPTGTAAASAPDAAEEDASLGPEHGPAQPSAEQAEQAEESPTEPAEPAACLSRQLDLRIEGPDNVVGQEPIVLTLVASTNQAECVLDLTDPQATVVVNSGNDRIWSTADCPEWQPAETYQLVEGEEVRYDLAWPVRRSAGCELREDVLGAGTYVATASIGSVTGRHVMQLQP